MSTTTTTEGTPAPAATTSAPTTSAKVYKTKPATKRSFKERVEACLTFYADARQRAPRKCDLPLLRDAREAANKQGEAYTSRGNAGFAWLNSDGKFTCTFNKKEKMLYTSFVTWDELKRRKQARLDAAESEFV